MTRQRKKWATSFPAVSGDEMKRHPSESATYRWIKEQAWEWTRGRVFSAAVTIWIDEGDGSGWCTFEQIDLRSVHINATPPDYDTEGASMTDRRRMWTAVTNAEFAYRCMFTADLTNAPPTPMLYSKNDQHFRPTRIDVTYDFSGGWVAAWITIRGPQVRKDGSDGQDLRKAVYDYNEAPAWLRALVEGQRSKLADIR